MSVAKSGAQLWRKDRVSQTFDLLSIMRVK